MSIGLKPLNCFVCLFCLWAGALPALAATWQEYRDAGLLAFENADYTESAEHFETALIAAHEAQASHQELGVILEGLRPPISLPDGFGALATRSYSGTAS